MSFINNAFLPNYAQTLKQAVLLSDDVTTTTAPTLNRKNTKRNFLRKKDPNRAQVSPTCCVI